MEEQNIIRHKCHHANGKLAYQGMGYRQEDRFIPHGKGKQYDEEGMLQYEGEFRDGAQDGKGRFYVRGRLRYKGDMSRGEYHGKGTVYMENGKKEYEGDLVHNCAQGVGKSYYPNGPVGVDLDF